MKTDPHPYARYRSAFVLAKFGAHDSEVRTVLEEAARDKDVKEMAQSYLDRMK